MPLLKDLTSFLHYWLKAQTLHSIHSPFVFQLCDQVILANKHYYDFDEIETLFEPLTNNNTLIDQLGETDFSDSFRPTVRQVIHRFEPSESVRHLLYKLVDFFCPQTVVVMGSNTGIATRYLAKGWHKSRLLSIEPCKQLAEISTEMMRDLQYVEIINENWQTGIATVIKKLTPIDFLWLNARHAGMNYIIFEQLVSALHSQSVVAFHLPCRALAEPLWKQVVANPHVRFSIDLWKIGLAFFNRQQPKQHFVLRW
ncbi:MAG: hypothetical protein RMJ44_02750 [Cytophagales bacterium]|nr:hypothetical protein [Bernardetiaceae bacterium]MDW8209981.1 hypothetical protein [Cytophagales bacterium]